MCICRHRECLKGESFIAVWCAAMWWRYLWLYHHNENNLTYFILFYFILFYSNLFYSILYYSLRFYSTLFYSILLYFILFYSNLFWPILFYSILHYHTSIPLLSPSIQSYLTSCNMHLHIISMTVSLVMWGDSHLDAVWLSSSSVASIRRWTRIPPTYVWG